MNYSARQFLQVLRRLLPRPTSGPLPKVSLTSSHTATTRDWCTSPQASPTTYVPAYLPLRFLFFFLVDRLYTSQHAIDIAKESFIELRDIERERIIFEVELSRRRERRSRTVEIGRAAWPVVVASLVRFDIVEIRVATEPTRPPVTTHSSSQSSSSELPRPPVTIFSGSQSSSSEPPRPPVTPLSSSPSSSKPPSPPLTPPPSSQPSFSEPPSYTSEGWVASGGWDASEEWHSDYSQTNLPPYRSQMSNSQSSSPTTPSLADRRLFPGSFYL